MSAKSTKQTITRGEYYQLLGLMVLADRVNRELAQFQKVTADDVLRVAKTYFRPEKRTVVNMLPAVMKPATPGTGAVLRPDRHHRRRSSCGSRSLRAQT